MLITEEDCDTDKYMEFKIEGREKDILDRCLAETIPGIGKKDDVIDSHIYNLLVSKDIESVKVRTPLTCETRNGICQKCYGILPDGKFPKIGYNAGLVDSQALTEASTQLVLRTKHSGAAFTGGDKEKKLMNSFDRLTQLLKVPEIVAEKATLTPVSGQVKEIKSNALGGWDLTVDKKTFSTAPGKKLKVKKGDWVTKGDMVTEGFIKPQELGELKGHTIAQNYLIDELDDLYGNSYKRKHFETTMRAISNNAEILETPDDSNYIRGDKGTIQELDYQNKLRKASGLAPIKYQPYFKSIDYLPHEREDWLHRISANRIVNAIKDGAARGSSTNLHGTNPLPAWLYAEEFGKGQFY